MRAPVIRLLRPEQWVKNLLVLAPWVFAGLSHDTSRAIGAFAAALIFTVASALVYVFNDYHDVESDRAHPIKRHTRPLATGELNRYTARAIAIALLIGLVIAAILFPSIALPLAAFLVLNFLYSTVLKHEPVLDLLAVAAGYLIRVYAGAEAVDVPLSGWMASTTFCLSLFLISSKRYVELSSGELGGRTVLSGYSTRFLNWFHWAAGAATLACYVFYIAAVRPQLIATVPVVVLGLGRYVYVTQALTHSESPSDVLWEDRPLLATVLLWGVMCVVLMPTA